MPIELTRRSFLQALGIAAATPMLPAMAMPEAEPVPQALATFPVVHSPKVINIKPRSIAIENYFDEICMDHVHIHRMVRSRTCKVVSLFDAETSASIKEAMDSGEPVLFRFQFNDDYQEIGGRVYFASLANMSGEVLNETHISIDLYRTV